MELRVQWNSLKKIFANRTSNRISFLLLITVPVHLKSMRNYSVPKVLKWCWQLISPGRKTLMHVHAFTAPSYYHSFYFLPILYNRPPSVIAYNAPSFPCVTSLKRCFSFSNNLSSPTTLLFFITSLAMWLLFKPAINKLFFHSGILSPVLTIDLSIPVSKS